MHRKISCVTLGVWEFPISLFAIEVAYLVHMECLCLVNPMVVSFCWRLMLLLVMGVEFENICTVSGKWNVSRVISRLYEWDCNISRVPLVIAEHGVVVASAGYRIRGNLGRYSRVVNFRFPFYKICVPKHWGHEILWS